MNLNNIREGELKDLFDALEEAFEATGTDYYIIGALARDVWYSRGNKTFRQTKDVDLAILVGSQEDYNAIKQYLSQNKGFTATKNNSFVMLTPAGVQVDILPFGEIEIDDGVTITGTGLSNIKVNGFMEVYKFGTEEIEMQTGHQFKIATLPAIVLLKLIAFDDRPEMRSKDARDIANIVAHFFDLQADFIYREHVNLFTEEESYRTLEQIAAIVIGREISKIVASNKTIKERLQRILKTHIELGADSLFVRNMVTETGSTVEGNVQVLQNMLLALNG
ncbi:nucleotidyl transferase AbiEii/AbiGii toxin family protein [Ferruginibacter profundus]